MVNNLLYYGDCLDVLRRHVADESVDLVYLGPPFQSNQTYNVLFMERDGSRAAAQIGVFEDTWRWDMAAGATYQEVVESGGRASQVRQAPKARRKEEQTQADLPMPLMADDEKSGATTRKRKLRRSKSEDESE